MTVNIEQLEVIATARINEITPSQELSDEQLQTLSTHSVADAVRYFSGTQIKDYSGVGGLKTVDVRSMGSSHVGVFYDGVQISNAQNGVVDLGRYSLDNMQAISLYNGQKSSIFQSAKDFASSSSIYLTSAVPRFETNKNYNLRFSHKIGSFTTLNPSLLYQHKLNDNLSLSLSSEYFFTEGDYQFTYSKSNGYDTTAYRENGDVRYLRTEGTLFGTINKGQWQAKLYYYDSERGYPGAVIRTGSSDFKNEDRQWDTNIFAQGSLRKNINNYYSFKLSAKLSHDYLHYISDANHTDSYDSEYTQQEAYLSLANLFTVGRFWNLGLSTDFQYNTLDANTFNFAYPERYTLLNALSSSTNIKGIRLQLSLLHSFVSERTRTSSEIDNKSNFSPSAVLHYSPAELKNLSLRAFYKRIFRMPTFNDMYYVSAGEPTLEPEYTTQYNIGLKYDFLKYFSFESDAYFNQVENKIVAIPGDNQFRWTMKNYGYVEIKGVDLKLSSALPLGQVIWSTRITYTYQQAQNLTDSNSPYYGNQIPYAPWHSGSLILGLNYRGWSLNYSFLYTGERYEQAANIIENYVQPWYTSDVSIGKQYNNYRLSLELNNIFDQSYEVVQNYPMPGVNINFKISVEL